MLRSDIAFSNASATCAPSPILAMSSRHLNIAASRKPRQVDLLNLSPMEGSAIKGVSMLTLNESDTKKTRPRKRDIGRICVRGYNTQFSHDDVVNALRKHFASCGEITDVYIFEKTDGLHSFGFIYFLGEGAVDKALQLSGIDVGGWTVIAEPYPFMEDAGCYPAVVVQGYDTLLDNADIEKMLFEHFSSCAEVTEIRVHKRSIGAAVVELYGEDAEQKVMDLDGSIMVGRKISVKLYTAPTVYSVHPRRRRNRNYYPVALCFDS
ncbi:nucleolin 1 [Brassica rapa]|uniref:nucleolin 1 n=1 Tax=Brassica campestris TaxID=3711 RepID=UPI0004F1C8E1|nr:nucleolin 1 [Brassica rapa]